MPPRYGPAGRVARTPLHRGAHVRAAARTATTGRTPTSPCVGVPFDTATSFRTGARFGPAAIRDQSLLIRPWHPQHAIDVFAGLSVLDGGDLAVTPGNAERTTAQIADGLAPLLAAGAVPLVLGGDHSIVLGELRAQAAVHGPVGVVLLDAHADTWDRYYGERYFHGTPFRRALEEGLIDAGALAAGRDARPALRGRRTWTSRASGASRSCRATSCAHGRPQQYGERVRARAGEGPLFLSFDIDVLDPAFAPGTGTPGGARAAAARGARVPARARRPALRRLRRRRGLAAVRRAGAGDGAQRRRRSPTSCSRSPPRAAA